MNSFTNFLFPGSLYGEGGKCGVCICAMGGGESAERHSSYAVGDKTEISQFNTSYTTLHVNKLT